MPSDPALSIANLRKTFKLYPRARDRLLELAGFGRRHSDFTALDNISLSLAKGEAIGVIGENGSGKSTLLKLVAGILMPDSGIIKANGRVTGLLELGTGFNPELSGRRNIYLNGVYLGLGREYLRKLEEKIIDFAELGPFIDEPLKSYSSGMAMRLGFAIAIHARPACFIIDEALSVGDTRFQQKCFASMDNFLRQGGGILFVSHDLNAVRLFCHRALLLNHGQQLFLGDTDTAVNMFNEVLAEKGDSGHATAQGYGNGLVRFTSCQLLDKNGKPATVFTSGDAVSLHFTWHCARPVENVSFGFMLRDRFGQEVFGTNSALLNAQATLAGPGHGFFDISALNIGKGIYTLSLAAHTGETHLENCFHWQDNALPLEVLEDPNYKFGGLARLKCGLRLKAKNGEKR